MTSTIENSGEGQAARALEPEVAALIVEALHLEM